MRIFRGNPSGIKSPIVGVVTKTSHRLFLRKSILVFGDDKPVFLTRAACLVTSTDRVLSSRLFATPSVSGVSPEELSQLEDGDVLHIDGSGVISRFWSISSDDNVVFVTNTCNCQCIMCPQPPRPDHEDLLRLNLRVLKLVDPKRVSRIGFTGGEPTLKLDSLLPLLDFSRKRFQNANIFLLTNGRRLEDIEIAKQISSACPGITYCVPLYSDVDTIHDAIVGVNGAFSDTVRCLHNLALLRQQIELRIVIFRNNYDRLPKMAEFIYRNFPFVSHIAFMGLETIGLADQNLDAIWVDPTEYVTQLKTAIVHLHRRDLCVSIYNLPLCLLQKTLWRFASDSISDWKKTFLAICECCAVKSQCSGIFATSRKQSDRISPIC